MSGRAVVLGLGRFGGGLGAANHLVRLGFDVTVTDAAPADELTDAAHRLAPEARRVFGGHEGIGVADTDLLVVNPAVPTPWQHPLVRDADRAGVRITTEIGLLLDELAEPGTAAHGSAAVVGITGTAGKSTTAAMLHAGLTAAGRRCVLGGNIGGSLLDRVEELAAAEVVVLELSSAMLWWLGRPLSCRTPPAFDIGAITNLAPNHIDWHGAFDHYAESKGVLARLAKRALIVGDDTAWKTDAPVVRPAPLAGDLALPGHHNRVNAALAVEACRTLAVEADAGVRAFSGLPHRLKLVHTSRRGTRYIDDSKCTTPQATRLAVESVLGEGAVHLIAGGYDKHVDLAELADAARACNAAWLIGETAKRLARARAGTDIETLDAAVRRAAESVPGGGTVLLSPGCASWDQFADYRERGERFCKLAVEHDP
ncbi:MAG: Mur ligase family protein [Planctomycetota bacterium]